MAFDCHVFHAYSNALVLWETCVRMFHVSLNEHSTSFFLYPVQLFPAQQKRRKKNQFTHCLSVCRCEESANRLSRCCVSVSHFHVSAIAISWILCLFHYTSSSALLRVPFFLFDCVCVYILYLLSFVNSVISFIPVFTEEHSVCTFNPGPHTKWVRWKMLAPFLYLYLINPLLCKIYSEPN